MSDEGASFAGDESRAEDGLIAALEQVDKYLECQEAVAALLKSGWFNIARARHAMGMHQVSSAMYNSTMEAQTTVSISGETCEDTRMPPQRQQSQQHSAQQQPGQSSASRAAVSEQHAQPDGNASVSDPIAVSANVLTQVAALQLQPHSNDSASTDSNSTKAAAGWQSWRAEIGPLQKCLRMFGAVPSLYLRTAQSDFVAATRLLARLAEIQQGLIPVARS